MLVPLQSVRDCQRPIQSVAEAAVQRRTAARNSLVGWAVVVELRATRRTCQNGGGKVNGVGGERPGRMKSRWRWMGRVGWFVDLWAGKC